MLLPGIEAATAAGTAEAAPRRRLPSVTDPLYLTPIADASAIPRFVNALPRPSRVDLTAGGTRTLRMSPAVQDLLGGGLGLTTPVWGFGTNKHTRGGGGSVSTPGPTLVARKDRPVHVHWANHLPFRHLLPVDTTIHWAYQDTQYTIARNGVPVVTHLHGGHSASRSDGYPEAWYTADGTQGPRFGGTRFSYENSQEAATLWYHDHTLGITRLNVYAGLAGFYFLRDRHELSLIEHHKLPSGPYEVELVLQDRTFYPDGRLAYPNVPADAPDWPGGPSIQPEFFGQVVLVNGKAWPYFEVEPRQYRLRLLNGSNSRFYRLSVDGSWPFPVTQIASDGGFLNRPFPLDGPLVISPGERVELIADFRGMRGSEFTVTNDAPTPFPDGDPVAPPADQILQFRVSRPLSRQVPEPHLPKTLRKAPFRVDERTARTRRLLLFETTGSYGRILPLLGTVERGALSWTEPITENPALNTAEIWEIFNTTADTHPIHLHLVQFQVLDSAPFTADQDPETGALSNIQVGTAEPPGPGDRGPKDTVQVPPGQVTRVKAFFDKRGRYVWHCHILEHEDNEMMRPYEVV
ncbi:multicopper oxidase family protein [Streptomyces sp. WMMB 322]|uniref:multicopper oxidase family protein n=1 Tax=Streptomyces sp. WMMB 322 TaxID=1286821 RepID=UPI0006E232AE|nr:multicopper oxidase [Streptomyces sp. WMMB 322]SCK35974.1 spore coat protein A [Streptomyces sp. WMMB 322]